MDKEKIYITSNHLDEQTGLFSLKVNDELVLMKDKKNPYDDEAIAVYRNDLKCAYVANSVCTVARGTYSAGRLYDKIKEKASCIVRFITQEEAIAEING